MRSDACRVTGDEMLRATSPVTRPLNLRDDRGHPSTRFASGQALGERGAASLWAVVFFSFVLGPLLAMGIELGRYAEARTMIQGAADLAALAAVQEADFPHFQATGEWVLLPTAPGVAQRYATANVRLGSAQRINPQVTGIEVVNNQAQLHLSADVSELFPAFIGHVTINVIGIAEFRMR